MNMPSARECANELLNDALPIAQRVQLAGDFFKERMASIPVTDRRHVIVFRAVVAELLESVPTELRPALEHVLRRTADHTAAKRKQESRQLATQLRSIAPGTAIIVRDRSGEKPVVFCEMRRTRFVFECPDGRRCTAPLQCFVRIEPGQPLRRVADSSNPHPLQHRTPNAVSQDAVKPMTPSRDPEIIRGVLDYVAGFPRNQREDPAQFLDDSFLDFDLKELIREVIGVVAAAGDIDWFREQVVQYPDAAVRNLVLNMLDADRSNCAPPHDLVAFRQPAQIQKGGCPRIAPERIAHRGTRSPHGPIQWRLYAIPRSACIIQWRRPDVRARRYGHAASSLSASRPRSAECRSCASPRLTAIATARGVPTTTTSCRPRVMRGHSDSGWQLHARKAVAGSFSGRRGPDPRRSAYRVAWHRH